MGTELWHAYAAGFFDADGSFCISRVKMGQYSDNHRLILDVAQHVDRIAVLHELQQSFGGRVFLKKQSRHAFAGAETIANWHIQKREDVERFVRAILPYLRCKRPQAEIALEFLAGTDVKRRVRRGGGASGRRFWLGTERLSADNIALREELRLRMRAANTPSTRRPLAATIIEPDVEPDDE